MKREIAPLLLSNSSIHMGFMPDAAEINPQIMEAYLRLRGEDFLRRSHFFGGRHENLYLERERIPGIGRVLEQAENYAVSILEYANDKLRSGFWINDMGHDAVTSEHDHDENDELLSGVYYVQVPQDSGELVIVDRHCRRLITPQAGMFIFFAPNVRHSVSANNSGNRRISVGMNFGPRN